MFSSLQKHQIMDGAECGLSIEQIKLYADPSYPYEVMCMIKEALVKDVSVETIQELMDRSDDYKDFCLRLKRLVKKDEIKDGNWQDYLKYMWILLFSLMIIYGFLFMIIFPIHHCEITFCDGYKIPYGDEFNPENAISNLELGKYAKLQMIDNRKFEEVGSFLIPYIIHERNQSSYYWYKLHVIDETPPILQLSDSKVYILKDCEFIPENYIVKAEDEIDGDLTSQVSCELKRLGKDRYEAIYTVRDLSGNKTMKRMQVIELSFEEYEQKLSEKMENGLE